MADEYKYKHRGGTLAQWADPEDGPPLENEIIVITDGGEGGVPVAKIGDGSTAAADLPAMGGEVSGTFVESGDAAGGDLAGTYPNPTVGSEVLGDSNWDPADPLGRDKIQAVEARHLVGGAGEPAFASLWANIGGFTPVSFWLDESTESVHFEGLARASGGDPPAESTIFTLPVGYRPLGATRFLNVATFGAALAISTLSVYTTGVVAIGANLPLNGIVYLDGVTFRI